MDADGNAYVVGHAADDLAGAKGGGDAFIQKVSATGEAAWTYQFGSTLCDKATGVAWDGTAVQGVDSVNIVQDVVPGS